MQSISEGKSQACDYDGDLGNSIASICSADTHYGTAILAAGRASLDANNTPIKISYSDGSNVPTCISSN